MTPAAARKQRAYRARQRTGEIVVRLPVRPSLIEGLLLSGRLDDAGSEDRDKVAAELECLLREWAGEWRKEAA